MAVSKRWDNGYVLLPDARQWGMGLPPGGHTAWPEKWWRPKCGCVHESAIRADNVLCTKIVNQCDEHRLRDDREWDEFLYDEGE